MSHERHGGITPHIRFSLFAANLSLTVDIHIEWLAVLLPIVFCDKLHPWVSMATLLLLLLIRLPFHLLRGCLERRHVQDI